MKRFLKFGGVIALAISLGACEKAVIPIPQVNWYDYTGHWENINASPADLDRISITRRAIGQISVQLWGTCGTEVCERALFTYSESELKEASLPLHIHWNKQELPARLGITASGKMELKAIADTPNTFDTQYFFWMQTASFYQQVTQTDARSLYLADTRINGAPRHPDNQLTAESILIFQTNEGRLGKIQVHSNDLYLSLRWQIWSPDGTVHRVKDYFPVYKSGYYDLDDGKVDDTPDHRYSDFYWSLENQAARWLEPLNGAAFAVYHLQ